MTSSRQPFAAAVCTWWVGENLINISVYMADARDLSLPLLARIPFDAEQAAAADAGRPFLDGPGRTSAAARAFADLAERVRDGWPAAAEAGA